MTQTVLELAVDHFNKYPDKAFNYYPKYNWVFKGHNTTKLHYSLGWEHGCYGAVSHCENPLVFMNQQMHGPKENEEAERAFVSFLTGDESPYRKFKGFLFPDEENVVSGVNINTPDFRFNHGIILAEPMSGPAPVAVSLFKVLKHPRLNPNNIWLWYELVTKYSLPPRVALVMATTFRYNKVNNCIMNYLYGSIMPYWHDGQSWYESIKNIIEGNIIGIGYLSKFPNWHGCDHLFWNKTPAGKQHLLHYVGAKKIFDDFKGKDAFGNTMDYSQYSSPIERWVEACVDVLRTEFKVNV